MCKYSFLKLALLAFVSMSVSAPAFASALLESAKQDFQLKRYHAAADSLNKVLQNEPANPEGYYWLGRALEELKDRDGAKTMYMSAFKLNPFGPQAPIAKKAMMDLATRQAQIDHPNDGPEVTQQALALIERQTADWKRIKINEGNLINQNRINAGNQQAYNMGYYAPNQAQNVPLPYMPTSPILGVGAIRQQVQSGGTGVNPYLNVGNPYANRTYDNWAGYPGNTQGVAGVPNYGGLNPGGYGGGYGGGYNGGYGTAYGAQGGYGGYNGGYGGYGGYTPNLYGRTPVSNGAQINTSYIRADSQVQGMRAQQQGVNSATELQKSANNLESLLGEKPRAGSPHLRALGTNLFVRNYSEHDDDSTPPVDPLIEMKATQIKLSDLEKGEQGAHAKALKLTP